MSLTEPTEALNLDFKQQRLFVTYYNNLPEKPSTTVRFFSHTDYYTVHGDDTPLASNFTGNFTKYMGENPKLSYLVLKKSQFNKFVRELLLVKQYRVEVYIKVAPNKINEWNVEFRGSPGNLSQFEETLFENATIDFSNYVMGIRIVKERTVAVACVNSTELKFQVCELKDNECFTELEALIAQIGPRECIIPQGESPDLISLKNVLERNSVLIARVKRTDFDSNQVQDLNRLLYFHKDQTRNVLSLPETKLTDALGCLNAVIKFLNLPEEEQNYNQFKLSTFDVNRYVRLDNAALYSLDILPKPGSSTIEGQFLLQNSSQLFCLKGVLDHCVTNQGKRLLEQWMKQPLKDINLINERLEVVDIFVKNQQVRQEVQSDKLGRLPDLIVLSKRLSSKKCNLQDCYRVYKVITAVPSLTQSLREMDNAFVKSMLIDPIEEVLIDLQKYEAMIEEYVDMDLVERGEFLVKRECSEKLNELFQAKEEVEEKMHKLLRNAANDLGFEQDKTIKLECNDQHGYFFRVTLKEEQALRSNSNFQIIDAIKGGVRFTNDQLLRLNDDYSDIMKSYEEEQKTVVAELVEVAAGYGDSLRTLNINIATVDVLVSFATASVSARIPYVRPKLHESGTGTFKLFKLRHPCIEQQENISFIPNNVEFDHNDKTLHIITGPNMCGKSTYIRSVGVCVLMAQIGSFVPCSYAEIPLIDAILSRVGAEDCQLKGLSTFMLEMIETSTIIESATANSLVIIDELGRGTSTYDGCGIAFAIAEHLAKEIKCFTLFATHFHEIARLAEVVPSVNNLHLTAVTTDNTITPLYQVREGQCDNSYGIHCARMVKFPTDVIEAAKEHQKKLEHSTGTQLIKDYEPELKRQVIQEGDKLIEDALKKLTDFDLDALSDEALLEEINKVKAELKDTGNMFIEGLLSD